MNRTRARTKTQLCGKLTGDYWFCPLSVVPSTIRDNWHWRSGISEFCRHDSARRLQVVVRRAFAFSCRGWGPIFWRHYSSVLSPAGCEYPMNTRANRVCERTKWRFVLFHLVRDVQLTCAPRRQGAKSAKRAQSVFGHERWVPISSFQRATYFDGHDGGFLGPQRETEELAYTPTEEGASHANGRFRYMLVCSR